MQPHPVHADDPPWLPGQTPGSVSRRESSFRTVAAVLALALLTNILPLLGADRTRPNIILAMADDLGWGDVGFNGNTVIQTPHLDAMAESGIRFERFYAPTVCSPTRGSCVTGRHPNRYGIFGANAGHLPPSEITLAELLRDHGYATGHFGKWHLGTLTRTETDSNRGGPTGAAHYSPPWENGFETTFSTEAKVPTWDPMLKPAGAKAGGPWWDAISDRSQATAYGTAYWTNGKRVTTGLDGDDSRIIMDRALPFMRDSVRAGKPFLAVIWFHAPHLPVVAGPRHAALYPDATPYERNYYGCIAAMDEQMGRLRSELRALNQSENTMLWFCSDNGPEGRAGQAPGTTGPLRGRKRDLWEGGIRVPGLLEWPLVVSAGQTISAPCVTSDFLPTVIDYLGLTDKSPSQLDGISIRALIEGKIQERPAPIGFEFGSMAVWLENRYKLVASLSGDRPGSKAKAAKKFFLYDIPSDPGESSDLSESFPEIVKSMSSALESWRESCRKSFIKP
ncbi:MAG: sulfatase-like hydrolase/transferase [Verrucomicrobia bacterium]|nr:sulfatase-like hydrolase/transferase [Verrucomicrobiota bacterium]